MVKGNNIVTAAVRWGVLGGKSEEKCGLWEVGLGSKDSAPFGLSPVDKVPRMRWRACARRYLLARCYAAEGYGQVEQDFWYNGLQGPLI